jgi:SOS-response transcriptional repressor LexA
MDMNTAIGGAIRALRKQKKWRLEDLSYSPDVELDPGNLSRVERGVQGIDPRKLQAIAKALGVTLSQLHEHAETLMSGRSMDFDSASNTDKVDRRRFPQAARELQESDVSNVHAIPNSPRMLPLLTTVQAGQPKEYIDDFAVGAADEYVEVDADLGRRLGPYAFALVVDGLSMINEFQPGDKVIVDPSEAVHPGAFVVAKVQGINGATLKKYRDRGADENGNEQFDLVPLNEDFSTIRVNSKNPGSIIGVVIEKRTRYR